MGCVKVKSTGKKVKRLKLGFIFCGFDGKSGRDRWKKYNE